MTRKDELRQQYLADLCATLREYVLAGHEIHVRTVHGRAVTDNQVVFEIPDWDAFAAFLDDVSATTS